MNDIEIVTIVTGWFITFFGGIICGYFSRIHIEKSYNKKKESVNEDGI